MNKFDEMKAEIKEKYPTMPLWGRILTVMDNPTECANTIHDGFDTYSQYWLTKHWRGKEWFVKFGRLNY